MSVVELAKKLTGLQIEKNSNLEIVLKKLPSLEELQIASGFELEENEDGYRTDLEFIGLSDVSLAEAQISGVEHSAKNPLFQEDESDNKINIDKKEAKEILNKFNAVYERIFKEKRTGIAEIDEIRKQAFYLRFIAQEFAERTAFYSSTVTEEDETYGFADDKYNFSLEDWIAVSQDVFHDTGNNITVSGETGKRGDGRKGAGSGGLGDKITKEEFELIERKLKEEGDFPDAKTLEALKDILIRADNVEITDGVYVFLDENNENDRKKVRAITLAREDAEERLESRVTQLLFSKGEYDFVKEIAEAFGVAANSLSANDLTLLKKIEDKVKKVAEKRAEIEKELIHSDIAGGVNKKLADELKKIYKDELEPLFAHLLKTSGVCKKYIEEKSKIIADEENVSFSVNDLSFPQSRLDKFKNANGDEKLLQDHERWFPIFIPKSNSVVVKLSEGKYPTSAAIINTTRKFIEDNPDSVKYPIEYKGADYFPSSERHLEFLLKCYVCDKVSQNPERFPLDLQNPSESDPVIQPFAYPHEAFVQIRAAMLPLGKDKILEIFQKLREVDKEFVEKFKKQNQWLIYAELTNLKTGEVCETNEDVVREMSGGKISELETERIIIEENCDLQLPTKEKRKGNVSCVVVVDSSEAFEKEGNPLGASKEKFEPYKKKLYEFLQKAKEAGVDRYEVQTDRHPEDHHNFLRNLLKDDNFFKAYKDYILLRLDREQGGNNKTQEQRKLYNEKVDRLKNGKKEEEDLIELLDSMAPYGLQIKMPQLLQVPSKDGKTVTTIGVRIGDCYYEAKQDEDGIKLLDRVANFLDKQLQPIAVSAWATHSCDETKLYQTGKGTVHKFLSDEFGVDINKAINKPASEGEAVSVDNLCNRDDTERLALFCKGQDKRIENYSPFFDEALGVNKKALFEEVKALYKLAKNKNAKTLSVSVAGIAYDFCVKSRVLDMMYFVYPALQALQILEDKGVEVNDEMIKQVVENIAKAAKQNRDSIPVAEALRNIEVDEKELTKEEIEEALKEVSDLEIIIPKGVTIAIIGEEKARAEMQEAAKKAKVKFLESEIDRVFENSGSCEVVSAATITEQAQQQDCEHPTSTSGGR